MLKIDLFNIIFTVINLLILFFVIWRFLFKPVKKIIKQRQDEIENQYAEAALAQKEADDIKAQYEESIKNAEDEKAAIIKEGKAKANADYDKILADAKTEAEKIVDSAKKNAEETKAKTMQQTKLEIADIVSEAAAKIAGTKSSPENDRKLFDDFIAKSGE